MKNIHQKTITSALFAVGAIALSEVVLAGDSSVSVATPDASKSPDAFKSLCDDIWGAAVFYNNPANPYVQKIAFTGRAQFDYAHIQGEGMRAGGPPDEDLHLDEWNDRRLRAGFKGTFFKDFTAHVEGDFQYDEDPVYQKLTDAYVSWSAGEEFGIKLGKQSMGFTMDGKTSSKELLTIDRSNLTNNIWFTNEYVPGLTFSGVIGKWSYNTGIFTQGEEDEEFGNFNADASWLATVGYDFASDLGVDEALLALDYVYNANTPTAPALFTNRTFEHIVSLNFQMEADDLGLRTDLSAASGYLTQSDVLALTVMPYYNFTDKLQGIFRYTFIRSEDDNGVRYARYESDLLPGTRGDQYQEAYLGLNYFLYGHKLKLQTGLQYVAMNDDANDGGDFDGLSWTTGLRISW